VVGWNGGPSQGQVGTHRNAREWADVCFFAGVIGTSMIVDSMVVLGIGAMLGGALWSARDQDLGRFVLSRVVLAYSHHRENDYATLGMWEQ
jgi:hypothetical protein